MQRNILSSIKRPIVRPVPRDGSGFSPASLYVSGEDGFFYDFSDTATLWQDTTATTAVTADGQTIGRIDDISGNGRYASQATAANEPTYRTTGVAECGGSHWLSVLNSQTGMNWLHETDGDACFGGLFTHGATADPQALYAMMGSNGASATNLGVYLQTDDRSSVPRDGVVIVSITDGVSPPHPYLVVTGDNQFINNVPSSYIINIPSAGPLELYIDGTLWGTSARADTQTGVNATYSLDVGAGGNGANPVVGDVYQAFAIDRTLTAQEISDLSTYFASKV